MAQHHVITQEQMSWRAGQVSSACALGPRRDLRAWDAVCLMMMRENGQVTMAVSSSSGGASTDMPNGAVIRRVQRTRPGDGPWQGLRVFTRSQYCHSRTTMAEQSFRNNLSQFRWACGMTCMTWTGE